MSSLLLSYYGDDLTGSTDVMEALASHGVPTVLFTDVPTAAQRSRFPEARAIGIAGTSRSETPAWMDAHLAPAFAALRGLGASVTHYKVCSTFDSAPQVGNIGRAAELGAAAFGQDVVPLVVGAPQLKRYTAFGNLFAAFRGETYRIDRHPVMSRHPVTPMREADLRLHLAAQTARPVTLADLVALAGPDPSATVDRLLATPDSLLLIDVADAATQAEAGRQLWRLAQAGRRFTVGSSGIEYALLAEWARQGLLPGTASFPAVAPVERLAVVSGSCSPTTEAQIRTALSDGFEGLALDPRDLIGPNREETVARAVADGTARLRQGKSVLAYTALGPATDLGAAMEGARHLVGRGLGRILAGLVAAERLTRAVVAGGDTSSHALREIETMALTTRMPLAASPGSPLCTAHSESAIFSGLEIAFKGGQVGDDHYFSRIRDGFPGI
ncbi:four-carbon acid sugar kinase family protein [Lichenifustis flavocetrariae]|uniref:Four-carbon acid sugar kinase family protein n=1 Tax=Lichenifustis flavocetrariae TaxID=2949735 RepID=A0AA41YXJ5_9HYPH|nr:four-carbon acid sugar kinase family protein [Lichenifustis flavocetrariae]MCW6508848.1 four-carbon acid sugar kinase family protein [Lichenifustis flavocetrariae]